MIHRKAINLTVFLSAIISMTMGNVASAGSINATISGELIDIPCKFSSENMDFDFKDVVSQEIDGKSHYVDQPVMVSCSIDGNLVPTSVLTVRVTGKHLDGAPDNVVASGIDNLGIALSNNESGKDVLLEQPIVGTSGATGMLFTLRGTLVNNSPGNTVDTGEFSTELLLTAEYE